MFIFCLLFLAGNLAWVQLHAPCRKIFMIPVVATTSQWCPGQAGIWAILIDVWEARYSFVASLSVCSYSSSLSRASSHCRLRRTLLSSRTAIMPADPNPKLPSWNFKPECPNFQLPIALHHNLFMVWYENLSSKVYLKESLFKFERNATATFHYFCPQFIMESAPSAKFGGPCLPYIIMESAPESLKDCG